LPLDTLPDLEHNQFYFHEIIDFEIIDQQRGTVGIVETIYSFTQNDLLVFKYQGKEILMPINDETIISVDRTLKKLHIALPDGLLEVYLTESNAKADDGDGNVEDGTSTRRKRAAKKPRTKK
jgi:16S rRNA processing protein RimM